MLANLESIEIQESFNTQNAKNQINTLHTNADRYITIATIDKNKKYNQWHYKINELEENLEKIISLNINTYISPNEFYKTQRAVENIRRINALYVDLDLTDKQYNINEYELNLAIEILKNEYFNKIIPEPTIIVRTGRGIHLYWKIEDIPKQGVALWTMVQKKIVERLENFTESFRLLKVDRVVTDCTRVLRLADTINTKNNSICTIEELFEENIYRLDNLIKEYFQELQIIKKQGKEKIKIKSKADRTIIAMYNLYSLHFARLNDIIKLQQIRNTFNLEGRRRMVFMYRYYSCLYTHDIELALENTLDFNRNFIEPLSEKEVVQASNSAENAYEEWLTNKAEDFKKPVWNRETNSYNIKGYNYSNTKLISLLEITIEEQRELSTIISKRVKLDRFNDKRKNDRRNQIGLTVKQQEIKDLKDKIIRIKESENLSIRKLAERLDVSASKIQRALKSNY